MSAAELRQAAALMRTRAEAVPSGPWEKEFSDVIRTDVPFGADGYLIAESATVERAEHIASWHPAVALAVADWLDTAGADLWAHGPLCECGSGCHECDDSLWQPHVRRALAVARQYLGTTP